VTEKEERVENESAAGTSISTGTEGDCMHERKCETCLQIRLQPTHQVFQ